MSIRDSGIVWLWLSVLFVVFDQVTKGIIVEQLALYDAVDVLPFFNIVHVHNYGAAFSFLSDAGGWQRWFFMAIAFVISGLLIHWLRQTPKNAYLLCMAYTSIIAGAIGNVYDRVQYGYVIDFLDFYYQQWHFPAFNVADICVVCGAFALLYDGFFNPQADNPLAK